MNLGGGGHKNEDHESLIANLCFHVEHFYTCCLPETYPCELGAQCPFVEKSCHQEEHK